MYNYNQYHFKFVHARLTYITHSYAEEKLLWQLIAINSYLLDVPV